MTPPKKSLMGGGHYSQFSGRSHFVRFSGNDQKWSDLTRNWSMLQKLLKSVHGRKSCGCSKLKVLGKKSEILDSSYSKIHQISSKVSSESNKIIKKFKKISFIFFLSLEINHSIQEVTKTTETCFFQLIFSPK